MPTRTARTAWNGNLVEGAGRASHLIAEAGGTGPG